MSVELELVGKDCAGWVFKAKLAEYQRGMLGFMYESDVLNIEPFECGSSSIRINAEHKHAYMALNTLKEVCE